MLKVLKWIGIVLGGLIGLILILILVAYLSTESRLNRTYDIPAEGIEAPTDEESIANGRRISQVCTGCHGPDLAGTEFLNDPVLGRVPAANLTPGEGGVGQTYTDADFERSIRHGVKADGTAMFIMPSTAFTYLSDSDVEDLIAYLHTLEPVDNDLGERMIALPARLLLFTGQIPYAVLLPVESIDQDAPHLASPPTDPVALGEYWTCTCRDCHGQNLNGGMIPFAEPGSPPAANLTPDMETGIGSWTEEDLIRAFREGVRPDGSSIDPVQMPWPEYAFLTDEELSAIYAYLQSLPPMPEGQ